MEHVHIIGIDLAKQSFQPPAQFDGAGRARPLR